MRASSECAASPDAKMPVSNSVRYAGRSRMTAFTVIGSPPISMRRPTTFSSLKYLTAMPRVSTTPSGRDSA